jgi:hypothetical protein
MRPHILEIASSSNDFPATLSLSRVAFPDCVSSFSVLFVDNEQVSGAGSANIRAELALFHPASPLTNKTNRLDFT